MTAAPYPAALRRSQSYSEQSRSCASYTSGTRRPWAVLPRVTQARTGGVYMTQLRLSRTAELPAQPHQAQIRHGETPSPRGPVSVDVGGHVAVRSEGRVSKCTPRAPCRHLVIVGVEWSQLTPLHTHTKQRGNISGRQVRPFAADILTTTWRLARHRTHQARSCRYFVCQV